MWQKQSFNLPVKEKPIATAYPLLSSSRASGASSSTIVRNARARSETVRSYGARYSNSRGSGGRTISSLRQRNCDIAILQAPGVIALEINRARLALVAVERASGDPGDVLTVDYSYAVAHYRHVASDQGHVVAFPLAWLRRHGARGS